MTAQMPFYYSTVLTWSGGKEGVLSAEGLPAVKVATPPEFDGPAGFWSPEHLFVAAANACIMATFLAIAANSKLAFKSYISAATGKVENVGGQGARITEITIKPRLTVVQEKDRERAKRIVAKAEEHCLISRSTKAAIIVDAEITAEGI